MIGWALVPLCAALGTWATLRQGWATRIAGMAVASAGSAGAWLLVSHHRPASLAVQSALFDAAVTACYFVAFRVAGQPVVGWQWLGAGLVIAGVLLLGWR